MSIAGSECRADEAIKEHIGMSPREIKAELILRGISVKEIAETAGVTSPAVTQTINHQKGSSFKGYRIREVIAKALGKPVNDIWPDQQKAI
ncbi:MAG TPA: helix-turn-helix domain-containing protein [Syntrophomonadaceae bacterium]|nr:helix-turn-helix domain-containing protein [Syntrophomonadaceae bacterium]